MELACREYGEGALVKLRRSVRDGTCDAFQKEFAAIASIQPRVTQLQPPGAASLPNSFPSTAASTTTCGQQQTPPNGGSPTDRWSRDGPEISTTDSAVSPKSEDSKTSVVPLVSQLPPETCPLLEVGALEGSVKAKVKSVRFEGGLNAEATAIEADLSENEPLAEFNELPDTDTKRAPNEALDFQVLDPEVIIIHIVQ